MTERPDSPAWRRLLELAVDPWERIWLRGVKAVGAERASREAVEAEGEP